MWQVGREEEVGPSEGQVRTSEQTTKGTTVDGFEQGQTFVRVGSAIQSDAGACLCMYVCV